MGIAEHEDRKAALEKGQTLHVLNLMWRSLPFDDFPKGCKGTFSVALGRVRLSHCATKQFVHGDPIGDPQNLLQIFSRFFACGPRIETFFQHTGTGKGEPFPPRKHIPPLVFTGVAQKPDITWIMGTTITYFARTGHELDEIGARIDQISERLSKIATRNALEMLPPKEATEFQGRFARWLQAPKTLVVERVLYELKEGDNRDRPARMLLLLSAYC